MNAEVFLPFLFVKHRNGISGHRITPDGTKTTWPRLPFYTHLSVSDREELLLADIYSGKIVFAVGEEKRWWEIDLFSSSGFALVASHMPVVLVRRGNMSYLAILGDKKSPELRPIPDVLLCPDTRQSTVVNRNCAWILTLTDKDEDPGYSLFCFGDGMEIVRTLPTKKSLVCPGILQWGEIKDERAIEVWSVDLPDAGSVPKTAYKVARVTHSSRARIQSVQSNEHGLAVLLRLEEKHIHSLAVFYPRGQRSPSWVIPLHWTFSAQLYLDGEHLYILTRNECVCWHLNEGYRWTVDLRQMKRFTSLFWAEINALCKSAYDGNQETDLQGSPIVFFLASKYPFLVSDNSVLRVDWD